jgi:aminoglycoside 6'-N-acetyltransferase
MTVEISPSERTMAPSPKTSDNRTPSRSGRVHLRPIVDTDRQRIVEIRSTEEVRRWWRGDDFGREFDDDLADGDLHQFAIDTADGHLVGLIQFSEEHDPDYRHASIDIFVDPRFHHRGFASEAIVTLADHLFDHWDHHRLVIDPAAANEAAIACYTKVGFRPVGVMRAYERSNEGGWSDGLLMDMLRTDRPRH